MFRGSSAPWPLFGGNDRRSRPSQKTGSLSDQWNVIDTSVRPSRWFTVTFVGIKGALNVKRTTDAQEADWLLLPVSSWSPSPPDPPVDCAAMLWLHFPLDNTPSMNMKTAVCRYSWQWWFYSSFSLRTKKNKLRFIWNAAYIFFSSLSTNEIVSTLCCCFSSSVELKRELSQRKQTHKFFFYSLMQI